MNRFFVKIALASLIGAVFMLMAFYPYSHRMEVSGLEMNGLDYYFLCNGLLTDELSEGLEPPAFFALCVPLWLVVITAARYVTRILDGSLYHSLIRCHTKRAWFRTHLQRICMPALVSFLFLQGFLLGFAFFDGMGLDSAYHQFYFGDSWRGAFALLLLGMARKMLFLFPVIMMLLYLSAKRKRVVLPCIIAFFLVIISMFLSIKTEFCPVYLLIHPSFPFVNLRMELFYVISMLLLVCFCLIHIRYSLKKLEF